MDLDDTCLQVNGFTVHFTLRTIIGKIIKMNRHNNYDDTK
jgi:hypothetical protein